MASVANRLHKLAAAEELSEALLKQASLGELTGVTQTREGLRDFARSAERPERAQYHMVLPQNVPAEEIRARLADIDAMQKIQNPRMVATMSALGGGLIGAAMPPAGVPRRIAVPVMAGAGALGGAMGTLGGNAVSNRFVRPELEKLLAEKEALGSVAEYSVLFDKVASGELGEGPRQALYGVCQAIEAPIAEEKSASVYDASNLSEEDARKARLDQLLKR